MIKLDVADDGKETRSNRERQIEEERKGKKKGPLSEREEERNGTQSPLYSLTTLSILGAQKPLSLIFPREEIRYTHTQLHPARPWETLQLPLTLSHKTPNFEC